MFKKTLLAASLAALSTGALAVDVATSSSSYTYGSEGVTNGTVANSFATIDLNEVVLELGAAYSVGDIIKISISGAEFDTADSYALTSSNASVIDTGFLSATANELVFRVTDAAAGTAAETLTLAAGSDIKLSSTTVGSKITVTASAETSTGITIDVAGSTKDSYTAGEVIQQHKFAVASANALDEKIDVADERKSLTAASDTATVTYTEVVPTFTASDFDVSGAGEISFKVNGSFTGFETGVTGSTNLGTVVIDGVAATVASDLQSGSAALPATATSDTMAIVFTPDTGATTRVVLNSGAYTVDVTLNDGSNASTYTGVSLGEFVLNGSSAQFAYAPVGFDTVTTQFEIGNSGTVDGEITITAFDTDGNDYEAMLPFKAEAGKLTRVADSDITTAFGLTEGTKLNLTFTVNAPTADITYAGYSNRGTTGRMAINKL